jgi:hypothetical protein
MEREELVGPEVSILPSHATEGDKEPSIGTQSRRSQTDPDESVQVQSRVLNLFISHWSGVFFCYNVNTYDNTM